MVHTKPPKQTSRNCITPLELMKYGSPCASYACMRLIQTLLSQQRVIKLKSNNLLAGRICNNFEKNRAFYDKSMKLGTWLVDTNT